MRQVEAERDDAVAQLLNLQDERRELQAQLSAKAADLRVNEGVVKQLEADVKQLEADLAEARRLHKAATSGPVEMLPVPRVTHSQALATSISWMTLGVVQPPASTAPVMQTTLMPAETTSIWATGAQAIAQPADSPYALQTVHGGCACHQPVENISYGRACPENASRASRYHYQYHTYVPSPPPGYHLEDLPMSQDGSPNPVPCQCDGKQCHSNLWLPVWGNLNSFWPHLPQSPWNTVHAPPTPAACELMDEAAAYPANTGPVCAVWPLPKPQGQ